MLRVFPNPERYKTCYVDDWDECIKKVDRDNKLLGAGLVGGTSSFIWYPPVITHS